MMNYREAEPFSCCMQLSQNSLLLSFSVIKFKVLHTLFFFSQENSGNSSVFTPNPKQINVAVLQQVWKLEFCGGISALYLFIVKQICNTSFISVRYLLCFTGQLDSSPPPPSKKRQSQNAWGENVKWSFACSVLSSKSFKLPLLKEFIFAI